MKVEHFRINIFWISKRNMEKYRTAGRLIILSLVISLQQHQNKNRRPRCIKVGNGSLKSKDPSFRESLRMLLLSSVAQRII